MGPGAKAARGLPIQQARRQYPAPETLRTESASVDAEGRRAYDFNYIRRLRQFMREALAAAERASADWHDLNNQHKERTSDPGRLFINKRDGIGNINDAFDTLKFHRDWAIMYASVLQAEESAAHLLRGA